jgi:hypothetical protein
MRSEGEGNEDSEEEDEEDEAEQDEIIEEDDDDDGSDPDIGGEDYLAMNEEGNQLSGFSPNSVSFELQTGANDPNQANAAENSNFLLI